uniref:Oxidoreductase-like domain-containing protein 1 n=1 Tax=Culex pipiens TaxID=7175 RepID=A0A8D8MNM4_CULPI
MMGVRIRKSLMSYFQMRYLCSKKGTGKTIELPEEPTNCCMSGCQNCVWIQYASELTKILDDGGEQAREIVLQKISDPSLKIFLRMELQNIDSAQSDAPTEPKSS